MQMRLVSAEVARGGHTMAEKSKVVPTHGTVKCKASPKLRWTNLLAYALLSRLAHLPAAAAYPPKVLEPIDNVAVEGGQSFQYQFDNNTFQSNKAGGALIYSISDTSGTILPTWLSFNPAERMLPGTPPSQTDLRFNWTLSATDRDAETSSISFLFFSTISCKAGQYRHFRLRLTTSMHQLHSSSPIAYFICSISFGTGQQDMPYFPVDPALAVYTSRLTGSTLTSTMNTRALLWPPALFSSSAV